MSENGSVDPHMVSIPSANIVFSEIDRRCHVFVNDRELPECETYAWFEAAINEKAARERRDENGLARCGCGGKAHMTDTKAKTDQTDNQNRQGCPYCSWIDPERLEDDEVDGPQNYCRVCGRYLRNPGEIGTKIDHNLRQ